MASETKNEGIENIQSSPVFPESDVPANKTDGENAQIFDVTSAETFSDIESVHGDAVPALKKKDTFLGIGGVIRAAFDTGIESPKPIPPVSSVSASGRKVPESGGTVFAIPSMPGKAGLPPVPADLVGEKKISPVVVSPPVPSVDGSGNNRTDGQDKTAATSEPSIPMISDVYKDAVISAAEWNELVSSSVSRTVDADVTDDQENSIVPESDRNEVGSSSEESANGMMKELIIDDESGGFGKLRDSSLAILHAEIIRAEQRLEPDRIGLETTAILNMKSLATWDEPEAASAKQDEVDEFVLEADDLLSDAFDQIHITGAPSPTGIAAATSLDSPIEIKASADGGSTWADNSLTTGIQDLDDNSSVMEEIDSDVFELDDALSENQSDPAIHVETGNSEVSGESKAGESGRIPHVAHEVSAQKISVPNEPSISRSVVVDGSLDLRPQMLELSTQLTNLTSQEFGCRPEWIGSNTIKLPSRQRECGRVFHFIEKNHSWNKKLMIAICSERGMGKTAFLSDLYEMLSLSPNDIVTIAPAQSKSRRPFASMRNLIAQRLYIVGSDIEGVKSQLQGAINSMISSRETAQRIFEKLWDLWLISKNTTGIPPVPTESRVEEFVEAVQAFFASDLKHNRVVLLFDDLLKFDRESIYLLARAYQELIDGPLTIVMTYSPDETLPKLIEQCRPEIHNLQSLSDDDLTWFTRKILEQMSRSREKLIVPSELCRSVAQYACGSPKRALNMMLEKFNPDQMMQWPDHLETLHQESEQSQVRKDLRRRLMSLPSRERALLGVASILRAPFTSHTMEAVTFETSLTEKTDCNLLLRHLHRLGFLAVSSDPILANSTTYTFKHEYERKMLASLVNRDVREKVYGNAAQWYALNNPDGRFNETIGDLWRAQKNNLEASHYYERVAYSSMSRGQYVRARALFKKFLDTLPNDNVARRIQVALDASRVSLRLGNSEESMRLARSAWRHALKLSAFSMAAAAALQIADVLIMMGIDRHVMQYVKKAREMLNISMIPALMLRSYVTEAKVLLQKLRFDRVRSLCDRANRFANRYDISAPDLMGLRQCEADLDALCGNPQEAIQRYQGIIKDAEIMQNNSVKAEAFRALGNLYFRLEEKSLSLDAWNKALGFVQETNDVFMHAGLLCDISEGAIALHALRTARATSEQSLSLAQKLGHRLFIARCLANNAEILFKHGQLVKALRALRKALVIAQKLHNQPLIFKILTITANCYGYDIMSVMKDEKHESGLQKLNQFKGAPAQSERLFKCISNFYEAHGMELDLALIQPSLASYYIATKQNIQALNAYRKALSIYRKCQAHKTCYKLEQNIEMLMKDTKIFPK